MKTKLALVIATILFGLSIALFLSSNSHQKEKRVEVTQPKNISSSSAEVEGAAYELNQENRYEVVRIIDGDTIEIEDGQKVRYIGIDTPESTTKLECFGQEAATKNKELVFGKAIRLEKDVSETDKYGRLLRYVFVDDIFINELLIKEGYANVFTYPPDVKYENLFIEAEREAQGAGLGLWGKICSDSKNQTQKGCLTKGNISSSGEKIYHMPGQKYYDKTVIEETKGEKWFCSEDEAQSAGFRKSKI